MLFQKLALNCLETEHCNRNGLESRGGYTLGDHLFCRGCFGSSETRIDCYFFCYWYDLAFQTDWWTLQLSFPHFGVEEADFCQF